MANGVHWTREQLLVLLRLYFEQPYGRLHLRNPAVHETARLTGRTPSAVVRKACNFASLDPTHRARGVEGLPNTSAADRALWAEFTEDSERIALESAEAFVRAGGIEAFDPVVDAPEHFATASAETEREALVRVRRVQHHFRRAVLTSYRGRCALSGIEDAELVNASHIVPWSVDPHRRADPYNGIALNPLFDRAFDRGLFTFDTDHRVCLSRRLFEQAESAELACSLDAIAGRQMALPNRFRPAESALAYHRENVFIER